MESVVITADNQQDPAQSQNQDQQKVQTPQDNQGDQRPSWLPPKFKTAEDLAKAYTDLEKAYTKQRQTQQKEGQQKADDQQKAEPNEAVKQNLGVAKALDLDKFAEEFAQTGELSADSYTELEKMGFSRNIVDDYVAGQIARVEFIKQDVYSTVGSEEQYASLIEWAKVSLDEGQIDAFNAIMEEGNLDKIKIAVQGLHSQYIQANGKPPTLVKGDGKVTGGQGYRSLAELTQAMSDPRYTTDEAYREDVRRKLSVSNIF